MSQLSTVSLDSLVQDAKQGDQSAFSQLVDASKNTITAIALAVVKDVDASEDIAQQVYIKVWKQLPTLKSDQSFLPWVRQMTRYTALNYLRDNKVQLRASGEETDALLAMLSSDAEDMHAQLSKEQVNQLIKQFIEALPDELRELVLLYYREEQSTQQVAQLLELTEANVRQKLSRARKQLKADWLAKHGKLLFTTAPGAGFTALIANLISSTSPVAAATLSTSVASSKSSFATKVAALLGGATIGALVAILAMLFSSKLVLENIQDPIYRPKLIRARNWMIGWIVLFAIVLTLSYELTSGWVAPVMSYLMFAIGLVRLVEITQAIAAQAGMKKSAKWCIDPASNRWKIRLMNLAGPILGFAGLLVGLYNSGRFLG